MEVKEVAEYLDVSLSQLQYYSHTRLKSNFTSWRRKLRLQEAKRLIEENPRRKLTSVRKAVGIEDKTHFRDSYYMEMGISPSDYKKMLLLQQRRYKRFDKLRRIVEQIRIIMKQK